MKIHKLFEENTLDVSSILTPDIKKIGKLFRDEGHEVRVVGGAVRDALLGKTPKDIDLATTATPQEMVGIGKKYDLRVVDTGSEHGTLTFVINDEPYEITTLRIDTETDGRHATVAWTRDFKEDARRRDLTYNAMSIDIEGKLYDYFNGHDDLKNKKTKFVGDANERIQEDYLRILRYFRFLSRQEGRTSDAETLSKIESNKDGLKNISAERIWAEVSKMAKQPNLEQALKEMESSGVLGAIGMPFNSNRVKASVQASKHPQIRPEAVIASLMVGSDLSSARHFVETMKMSLPEQKVMTYILSQSHIKNTESSFLESIFLDGIDPELVHQSALANGDTVALNAYQKAKNAEPFPITGKDLIEQGFTPGPEFGRIINSLKKEWIQSGFKLNKQQLLGKVK